MKTWYYHYLPKRQRANNLAIQLIRRNGFKADKFIHEPLSLLVDKPKRFINILGFKIGFIQSNFLGENRIYFAFFE